MIRVKSKEAPPDFDRVVRSPGQKFLTTHRRPTAKQFRSHNYWVKILKQLHENYNGICAYSCHFIPYDTGSDTVEHFKPKSLHPSEAYSWNNYRLVCATLNGRKGNREDVLDPFVIDDSWFSLEFPSLLVKPTRDLNKNLKKMVFTTCMRLGLNDENTCLKSRERYIKDYCQGHIDFFYLSRDAPFIARELRKQNLVDRIRDIMDYSSVSENE